MSLDFRHTCPEIDDCISDAEVTIKEHLKELIEGFLPSDFLNESDWKYSRFLDEVSEKLSSTIKPLFERLRSLNSEVRNEADKQIEDLAKDLDWKDNELRETKESLEGEIHSLEQENNDLENHIIELRDEVYSLKEMLSNYED